MAFAVKDINAGRVLIQKNADHLSHIASNVKILTSSAALAKLGPGFRYRTSMLAKAIDERGVVTGDLYLRGRGDPALSAADLDRLANELALLGVTSVRGRLIVDDSYFDGQVTPPHFDSFTDRTDEHASFRAPVGALTVERGTFALVLSPNLSGRGPARISIDPPNAYVRVTDNGVLTQSTGRERIDLQMADQKDHVQVTVGGQIRRLDRPRRFVLRVGDPVLYAGAVVHEALRRRGIRVRGRVQRGTTPPGARILATVKSAPLSMLVRQLGKRSNNAVAEALLVTLGAETIAVKQNRAATWADGVSALRAFLVDDIGLSNEAQAFRVANGSGLYGDTRMSPNQLNHVLEIAYRDPRYGPDFVASLAIAGVDGTLSRRMTTSPASGLIRAKTGTLGMVSALSGYAGMPGGATLVFSIVVSELPNKRSTKKRSRRAARKMQDRLAETLMLYLRGPIREPDIDE